MDAKLSLHLVNLVQSIKPSSDCQGAVFCHSWKLSRCESGAGEAVSRCQQQSGAVGPAAGAGAAGAACLAEQAG